MTIFQFLDPKVILSLKRNFPWYVIVILCGVVMFQEKQKQSLTSENRDLYKAGAIKDSIILMKTQDNLKVYQDFMLNLNNLLILQKFQIQKTDTIIEKVTKSK